MSDKLREPIEAINMHIHYGRLEITEEKDGMYADIHKVRALESYTDDLESKLKVAEEAIDYTLNDMSDPDEAKSLLIQALRSLKEE